MNNSHFLPLAALRSASSYDSSRKIKIYDSLNGTKADFLPIASPTVRMYVCGLTPYDHPHIGHACNGVRFDMVRRYLSYRNLDVQFQTNLTDIDDKIIKRATDTGENPAVFTERYSREYDEGVTQLGVLPPTYFTKVTECLPEIRKFIADLITRGFAYVTATGNVYFDIEKKADYGKLSGQRLNELMTGTRDREPDPEKKNPVDFALWKRDDSVLSGESEWGQGRPGWHIECSAMIHATLGSHIDIHGGGLDLKFPHHENEIAQSEAHSDTFVNIWMHSGLLTVEGTKMSKSLGNFFTIAQALEKFGGELIRFVILRHQYRSEIGFSDQLFRENLNSLVDFYKVLGRAHALEALQDSAVGSNETSRALIAEFEESMDNDFHTPGALVALSTALATLRKALDSGTTDTPLASTIRGLGAVLGLFQTDARKLYTDCIGFSCRSRNMEVKSLEQVEGLVSERTAARQAKDFARGDAIRAELSAIGVEVADGKGGQASDWRFLVS